MRPRRNAFLLVLLGVYAAFGISGPGLAAAIAPRMLLLDGAVAGGAVIAVGERGTILRSLDHGRSWEAAKSPSAATLTGVSFAPDGQHGWAVGHDAMILATSDGGVSWTKQFQGENLQDSFLDVLAVDADHILAIGAYGLCVASNDRGQTWARRQVIAQDNHLNRISRGPTGTLYIAGENGTLVRSTDKGATWTAMTSPYTGSFYGVVSVEPGILVAHGLRGHLFRSTDDGATWEAVATPQPALLATAVARKNGFLIFAGQARTLLVSADGGRSVRASAEARSTAVAELIELDNGSLLALGEDGANVLELGRIGPAEGSPNAP